MLRYIFRRMLETIPVLWAIVTLTFFMLRVAPGGPFTSEKAVTPEVLQSLEAHYGLNQPLYRQYFHYVANLLHGDLGPSFHYTNRSVNEIIADKLPVSIELGLISLAVALGVGLTAGIIAAVRRNTWIDYTASTLAMVGICVPTFVMGPLLVLLFAIQLGWTNATGWYSPLDRILPSITLGLAYAAYIARLTRAGMIETLSQDFVRTARAKGASELRIIFRHALRGGLLPVIAYLGPATAGIITGSFVVETIFQIPGLGREFVTSATSRDYTLVLGTVLIYALFIVALNLVVDLVQAWMNPRLTLD